jgi:PrtD family type I secretion system ABC transporter
MLQVFDRVLTTGSTDTLIHLTLIALAALLALGFLDSARGRVLNRISSFLEELLVPLAFERSLMNAMRGRPYRSEAVRDVREMRGFLQGPGILAVFDLPWSPIFLAAIFVLHPVLGFVSAGSTLLLLGLALLNDVRSRRYLKSASEAGMRALWELDLFNRSAEVIDALGMMNSIKRRWLLDNRETLQLQMVANDRAATIAGLAKFCRYAVQVLILGAGAWLVTTHALTAGAMIAGSILLSRALAPIDQVLGTWRQIVAAYGAYKRLHASFAEPPIRPEGMPLPAPRGDLTIEDVHYKAPASGASILDDVSFGARPGEILVIVGPSAAGKSTLARLLVGTQAPSSGYVRLDGADVFAWDRERLAKHIGYLPQDVALFSGTVAENIARLGDVDPTAVVEAAQRAGVHDMILRLPRGYDTEIGEAGLRLSGGQRQRIALARAIFGNPSLVVLDEPNSNLDADGEAALVRALSELRANSVTIIVITHRPALVNYADRLLVLRNGCVAMHGPREDVLARFRRSEISAVPANESAIQFSRSHESSTEPKTRLRAARHASKFK